jgi:hypothetical protein
VTILGIRNRACHDSTPSNRTISCPSHGWGTSSASVSSATARPPSPSGCFVDTFTFIVVIHRPQCVVWLRCLRTLLEGPHAVRCVTGRAVLCERVLRLRTSTHACSQASLTHQMNPQQLPLTTCPVRVYDCSSLHHTHHTHTHTHTHTRTNPPTHTHTHTSTRL